MTSTQLFTPRPDIVALLADCLRHPGTELDLSQVPDWKHTDGRPVTEAEVSAIRSAKLGEIRDAVDLNCAAGEKVLEYARTTARLLELVRPYAPDDSMPIVEMLPLMPPDERAEADEILTRITV